ncbi:MAG: hypothetical protein A2V93_09680 [Ignavibacteria bacterium RBG_16_34_14]|nr:MAG: hypothetical protein A2V93_09680 [Ignavibacteria bacterium RBG_16_34_14]
MKQTNLINLIFFSFILLLMSFMFVDCKDETTSPEEIQPILDDLFPLVSGRVITYGEGTLLLNDTQTPIAGTEIGFKSTWEVGLNVPPNPVIIYDTTNIPAVGLTVPREFYIKKDTSTGNFDFLTNLGFLFRSQKIYNTPGDSTSGIEGDSLVWIGLSKSTMGVGREWIAYTKNYTSATLGPIRFEIIGKFETKETFTIAGTNYETYKLTATRKIYLGSSTTAISIGTTAILWLAPNVGPVKIILIGDAENHGKSQTMTSKNF